MFLAGDRRPSTPPVGGQGINTGIQAATTSAESWPRFHGAPHRRCSTATKPSGDQSQPACSRSRRAPQTGTPAEGHPYRPRSDRTSHPCCPTPTIYLISDDPVPARPAG
ncbi:hypothetical protein ABZ388_12285 [Micromonospora parva]|uniref:hypothetical protein n=1 Tax=Micromonospora TaxID=1873 RepID=UPI0028123C4E|nr:hypothetical protein [Micromonospora sp. M51]